VFALNTFRGFVGLRPSRRDHDAPLKRHCACAAPALSPRSQSRERERPASGDATVTDAHRPRRALLRGVEFAHEDRFVRVALLARKNGIGAVLVLVSWLLGRLLPVVFAIQCSLILNNSYHHSNPPSRC
jgi:hypothetical protein